MKVSLEVKEGRREVLAEVAVEGGSPKQQARAKRRLRLEPGEPVVLDQWAEARRRRLRNRPLPERRPRAQPLRLSARGEGDRPVKAKLTLEPWPALRLRYGLQVLTGGSLASEEGRKELQVGAVTEVSRQTLFGRAAAIGVERPGAQGRPGGEGLPERAAKLRHSGPLEPLPHHDPRAQHDDEVLGGQVDIRKTELTWEERIRATRRLDFAAAYKLQWNRFDFGQPADGSGGNRSSRHQPRPPGRNRALRRPQQPHRHHARLVQLGEPGVGRRARSARTTRSPEPSCSSSSTCPLPGGTVFGAAARVEGAKGQGSAFLDTDRLQAGRRQHGSRFRDDALTSRSIVNFLGGSTTLLVLNAELRFPIHGPVRGVLFGDGAISRAKFSDESSRESIWSTGLGLRYVTPVGILRLDYGIPLDEGFKPKRGRVYFSLGQVF